MGLFDGKKGVVFGIANDRSIAWAITQKLAEEGAEIGFTHLPDHDDRRKNEKKVRKLVEPIGAKFVVPCDVQKDEDLDAVFATTEKEFGKIDFALLSGGASSATAAERATADAEAQAVRHASQATHARHTSENSTRYSSPLRFALVASDHVPGPPVLAPNRGMLEHGNAACEL